MYKNRKWVKYILIAVVIISVGFGCAELWRGREKKTEASAFHGIVEELVMEPYLPGIRRMSEANHMPSGDGFLRKALLAQYPGLLYALENGTESVTESDYARLPLPEGSDEDYKGLPEEALEYGDDAMHLEKNLESALLKENERYLSAEQEEEPEPETDDGEEEQSFARAEEKSYRYRFEELSSYEELIKAFYAVDSTTVAGEGLCGRRRFWKRICGFRGMRTRPRFCFITPIPRRALRIPCRVTRTEGSWGRESIWRSFCGRNMGTM